VAELMVRQGMTVSAGASLVRVNGLASVWIEAAVPEAQSGPLQLGQDAQVRLAAFPGETLKARVVSILPEANRDTRTVRVRLELPNPGQRLKAGMSGQITLLAGRTATSAAGAQRSGDPHRQAGPGLRGGRPWQVPPRPGATGRGNR
jgi:Cu(I)/Ag(I) efflux system membrane fusion protein